MVYLFNKKSKIIEVDLKKQLVWGNNIPIDTKLQLEKSLSGYQVSGFPSDLTDEIVNLFNRQFNVTMSVINPKNKFEMLDSKSNTCAAMSKLKEKYTDDSKMQHYINLFFPETGFIHSLKDIDNLLKSKKNKGLVIKLDQGKVNMNVLVLPPDELQKFTSSEEVIVAIANRFRSFQTIKDVLKSMSNNKLIWQEFVDIQNEEMRALYYLTSDNRLAFGGYSTSVTENGYWKTIHSVPQGHKAIFDAIDNDAFQYFNRIVKELMDTHINLHSEFSNGLYDESINLRVFCVDILPNRVNNKIVPVISEVNPNFTGNHFAYHSFMEFQAQQAIDSKQLHSWLLSYPINIPQQLDAQEIVTTIKSVYSEHFDIKKDPFDLGGFIFGTDETYLILGLNFPTLAKNTTKEYIERMDKFSMNLQSQLKTQRSLN
jgi:hypothetical protein